MLEDSLLGYNAIHLNELENYRSLRLYRQKWFIKNYFDYTCIYCGKYDPKITIDHIIPKSKGGTNTLDNLGTACRECNIKKSDFLVEEWYTPENQWYDPLRHKTILGILNGDIIEYLLYLEENSMAVPENYILMQKGYEESVSEEEYENEPEDLSKPTLHQILFSIDKKDHDLREELLELLEEEYESDEKDVA